MKLAHVSRLIVTCCFIAGADIMVAAQDGGQSRSITSDDFASKRPAASKSSGLGKVGKMGKVKRPKQKAGPKYFYVRPKKRTAVRWSKAPRPNTKTAKTAVKPQKKISEVGVTIWRMNGSIAERVNSVDPIFAAGDRIRLGIESPVTGFLYIVNSEISDDGSLGRPRLIFPTSESTNNKIFPGMLFDIPDHTDKIPYFTMEPKKGSYAGEAVAVIISHKSLHFRLGAGLAILNLDDLDEITADTKMEVFARTDTEDKVFTAIEAQASCGASTRELVRVKTTEQPCGTASRELTQDGPKPQMIYRVATASGKPVVAFVELKTKP